MCTPFFHRMESLTIATVHKSTKSVRALQGLPNNRKQTHTTAFLMRGLRPTRTRGVGRKTVISVLGKGGCSGSLHFERSCGLDGVRRAAGLPWDSEGGLPPPWGNSEPAGGKAEAQIAGGLTGSCHTPWRADPMLAEPDDISQPLLVIVPIFVLKSK